MQIEVNMSLEEYQRVNRIWLTHTTAWRRWNFWFVRYLYPMLGIAMIIIAGLIYSGARAFNGTVLTNLSFGLFLLYCALQYPRRVRKLYNQQAAHFVGTITLAPSGLDYVRKDGSANIHYAWCAFELWIERPEEFILIPGPASFLRVPKLHLTSLEQDEVRKWLAPVKLAK